MVVSEAFIKFMGYETEGDLYTASELVVSEGLDIGWYVTPRLNIAPTQWVAWDDANPADPAHIVYASYEEAVADLVAAVKDAPGAVVVLDREEDPS